jgi:hypothetical protein
MSSKPDSTPALPSPWPEFLEELDKLLPSAVELHCLGGFVLTALYGLPRTTGDIDYVSAIPTEEGKAVEAVAGPGSKLARKHKLSVHRVEWVETPEDYETRLIEICPGRFSNLRLLALDPHDVVLAKLTRNNPVDNEDVEFLAKAGVLDATTLQERYRQELRPYLADEKKHDLTLQLWLEDYFQEGSAV